VLAASAAWLVFASGSAAALLAYGEHKAPQPAGSTTQIVPVVTQPTTRDPFDWIDAAIGAAAVIGLLLVAVGTASVVLRRMQNQVLVDIDLGGKEHDG
jgi:hypothetical protein